MAQDNIGPSSFGTPFATALPVFDGVLLPLAFFGMLIWIAVWHGWRSRQNTRALVSVALVIAAAILSIGLSGSHVRRPRSGQADVDEVEGR